MYSTCLFCNEALGSNEVIEHFPVGRRLAFDAAKGRLWVVCGRCERWNLTPLEERWEAIEEGERLFSETRLRVSTDNIGLAKLKEGLVLIRIGGALRPEIAAWRYGDQFGRRRRKHLALSALGVAAVAGIAIAGPATGWIAGGGWGLWQGANALHNVYQSRRVRVRLRLPDSETVIPIRKNHLDHTSIVNVDDGWGLRVSLRKSGDSNAFTKSDESPRVLLYTGKQALRAASKLLPAINASGAKAGEVQSAVTLIGEAGDPVRLFHRYAGMQPSSRKRSVEGRGHYLRKLPKEVRLALEMASHEEQERRALEGELALLQAAWQEAEEVAQISDDMFVPERVASRWEELKQEG
jgi:hypothetical protein